MSTCAPTPQQYSDAGVLSAILAVNRAGLPDTREVWGQALAYPAVASKYPFLAGSQAKMYTAACISLLVKSQSLALDEPVHRYIPSCPDGIDVISLLTHTSGLGDHVTAVLQRNGVTANGDPTCADLVALAQGAGSSYGKGTFAYSNTGYLLLAMLIERVAGESLATFAAKRIFNPLGMYHTRFIDGETRSAWPLLRRLDQLLVADGCLRIGVFQLLSLAHGSGNLMTTIDDSLIFGRALLSGVELPELSLAQLQERGLERVVLSSHRLCGHRAHFLAVSSGMLVETTTATAAAYCVEHRCPRDLKPSRDLLLYCEWLAMRAFGNQAA